MPVFEFKGLNEAGKVIQGLRDAESPKALRQTLRREGVFLTDVLGEKGATVGKDGKTAAPAAGQISFAFLTERVSAEDISIMTRQLAVLIGAGVTLIEALTALIDQIENEKLKRILSEVKQNVNEGSTLADALGKHPKAFGNLYVNMIRAGESSGALDVVLIRLADFTESQARLQSKIIGTLTYPAIMILMSLVILGILFTFVVPKVTKIFEDAKVTLPFTTRALIFTSNLTRDYWYVMVVVVVGAVWGFFKWKDSASGRPQWDKITLKVPLFGPLIRMVAISRFARTLATLLKSGVPLLSSMDIVRNIVSNSVLSKVIESSAISIREGESIAAPLKRSGEFPPLVYHMVAIGERSGQLEEMLVNVAVAYETQVDVRISALTSLLEPILIVVMGGVVAFIVFSILMPILQLNTVIH
jgi:general secretion pathway protein F